MGRSLHCHLATKRLTDPTQLIMAEVFWWQGCGGGGKRVGGWEWVHTRQQQHGCGALRLSPSLGLGWAAALMFESQHDSLLPPRGLCVTDRPTRITPCLPDSLYGRVGVALLPGTGKDGV